jgi:hypothetical protein
VVIAGWAFAGRVNRLRRANPMLSSVAMLADWLAGSMV